MKTKENQPGQVSLRSIRSNAINRGQSRSNQAFGSPPNACQLACRHGDAPASELEVSQTTQYKGAYRYLCGETSYKPTSRYLRMSPIWITSGLPTIRPEHHLLRPDCDVSLRNSERGRRECCPLSMTCVSEAPTDKCRPSGWDSWISPFGSAWRSLLFERVAQRA
jgi:hypothetical protein